MLTAQDIAGFFAERSELHLEDYVLLTYIFETQDDPRQIAAQLCSEQSTAQWNRPGIEEDFRVLYGAKVVCLNECRGDPCDRPSSRADTRSAPTKQYLVQIAHPHRNFGARIPNFLAAAAGEGPFYCPGIETIKWMDFEFPENFLKNFEGPKFGMKGIRKILGVEDRPIFIGVVKPNIGLPPKEFAEIAYEAWLGGLDIAKDDEMLADIDWSPLAERVRLTSEAKARAEKETGHQKIFVANITDEVDQILNLHDLAVKNGANAVMVNSILTGISALRALRRKTQVPVMSHFTGTACLSRPPHFGISSLVLTKLQRLVGGDIIALAGFGERMKCSDDEVLQNVEACLKPWGHILPALPVPGGSDSAATFPGVFQKIGHPNFGFISGRGVFGHPEGPTAGAQSLHHAWKKIASTNS